MSYRPEHFGIRELVPPDVYRDRGETAWQLLDDRALEMLDALRERFGPITVNTWAWGGGYTESGLRRAQTSTGAEFSQHKFGRAFDCKFDDVTPQKVSEYIQANPEKFPYITTLENTDFTQGTYRDWLHFDCRNGERIRVVDP